MNDTEILARSASIEMSREELLKIALALLDLIPKKKAA